MKAFQNAVDFRKSLEKRSLKKAQTEGIDLQRIRKQVAFERFLARLLNREDSPWILKGGHTMEQTFNRRGTHELPENLNSPPQEWDKTFEVLAKQCKLEGDIKSVFAMICEYL